MSNKENIKSRKEFNIIMSIVFILFIIYVSSIHKLGIFYVLDDEFGYWSNAAYLAGYDWSSVTSNISYYSYGYSILLVPLFWIFENTINMYKAAIVLNALMLCISFLICYDISKKLARNTNKYLLMLLSFIISLYPAYLVQVNIAWSECTLILTCWLITWLFVKLNGKTNYFLLASLGCISVFAYVIHQRALGILISSIVSIFLMMLLKKINWKQFLSFIIPVIVLMVIHKLIKNDIKVNNYLFSNTIDNNDFSGQILKINNLLSFDGFKNFAQILISQLYYLGASSFLLCYFGIYEMLLRIKKFIIIDISSKNTDKIKNYDNAYLYFFLLMSFLSTIVISAIFMSFPERIDHIIYGRYTEMIIGPLILIGLLNFIGENKIQFKGFTFVIIIFIFFTIITNLTLSAYGFTNYNTICAVSLLIKPSAENNYNVYMSAIIAVILSCLCYLSFYFINHSYKKIFFLVAMISMAGSFLVTGESFVVFDIGGPGDYGIKKNMENIEIANFINENNPELPVYFLLSNDFINNRSKDFYQFLLKERKIICVTSEQLSSIEGDKYVIVGGFNNDLLKLLENYKFCLNAANSYLLVSDTSQNREYTNKNGFAMPLDIFYKNNAVDSEFIQGNGTEGFFMYGPYLSLNSGNYKFTVEIELIDTKDDVLGFIDVVSNSGNKQYFKQEIYLKDFFENKLLIMEVPITLKENDSNIELRAFSLQGTQLRINNIYIQN